MGDGRLNYMHINKDTPLDYTAMTDRYAGKRPRRMLLVNPLQEPEEQITDYDNLKFVRFLLYLTSHAMLVLQLIDKHLYGFILCHAGCAPNQVLDPPLSRTVKH